MGFFSKHILIATATLILLAPIRAGAAQTFGELNIHFANEFVRSITEDEVKSFLPVKTGDVYSPQKLDQAIDYLHKWGIFEAINVETRATASSVELDIFLKEAVLIGEIDIAGNYPYVEPKIRKHMTMRAGDIYTAERIDEQINRIKQFYEREGFLNTKVYATQEWNESTGDVSVTFRIKYGSILRYGNIEISGNQAYPNGRIISAINPLRRYKPREFSEAIRKVTDFYHSHGYPRAYIHVEKKEIDVEKRRINVSLHMNEGPHVKVAFKGNEGFSNRKLRKLVTIYKEGSFDEFELETSAKELVEYYNLYGYPDASVSFSRADVSDKNVLIEFTINEGKKLTVVKLDVEGSERLPAAKIKKKIKTQEISLFNKGAFNKGLLAEDTDLIKKYYESEGFLNAEVGKPAVQENRDGLAVTIPVAENDRTIVQNIVFNGNTSFPDKAILKKLKTRAGKPLNPFLLAEDKQAVLMFYGDNGHPYAEMKQFADLGPDSSATIRYEITENDAVKIGKVVVVGNILTAMKSIKKALSIKEGEPFSYDKISRGQLSLRRLSAFVTVNIEPIGLAEREKVVNIRVKVEEAKPFILDFEGGYSTDLGLRGTIDFINVNAFGRAKRFHLLLMGGSQLSQGQATFTDPTFAGSDVEFSTSAWLKYQKEPAFNYLQPGLGFGFFRRFHRTGLSAKYELMKNYFVGGDATAASEESLRDNTVSKITLSPSFDTRNSFSEPTRGIYTKAEGSVFIEMTKKDANFFKFRYLFGQYNGFLRYFVFTNNARFDKIFTVAAATSVPANELLFLGGDDTIRGFTNNSLGPQDTNGNATGGEFRWIYNAELSLKPTKNWRLVGFFDIGALTNAFDQMTWDQVRYSTGPGLRYITPVGPVRLDYGIKLNRRTGEDFGRLHFTFGYVF